MDSQIAERIRQYVMGSVKPARYEHSLRTAETCRKMCAVYGQNADKGYLAGIAHDMCKEMPARLLISLAEQDGSPVSALEAEKPSLLHGRAAAVKLYADYGIYDDDILNAVRNHTFGRAGMSGLEKILYVADKIEPGRPHSSSAYVSGLLKYSLDTVVLKILRDNLEYLKASGKAVAPATFALYEELQSQPERKKGGKR
ncbi:MAG TPA: bis(5'-nucleosyl)-tetraphosphatase (symmetrical) YqeK [Candidatus Treponema faecavium]|nr:bis(5'-nucleosyl)-tetraphosphatase (symmetrical) YqeK [Candidatus Treponema faecavium]